MSLSFLNGFEGEIDGTFKDNKPGSQATPLSIFVKSSKIRFEIPEGLAKSSGAPIGEKAYAIFDSGKKELLVVSDAQKQAMVFDMSTGQKALHPLSPGGRGAAPQGPPSKITKTGKTDTVAGYTCEYWDIASDHKEGTVCMGDQGASWFSLPTIGMPADQAWMADLVDGKHFPLRFIGYQKDGVTEESRIEVTKIDKKSEPDTLFSVPPGYKTLDLEKMLQSMGGAGAIPGGPLGPHVPPHAPPH